jgi:hypothetical protein
MPLLKRFNTLGKHGRALLSSTENSYPLLVEIQASERNPRCE